VVITLKTINNDSNTGDLKDDIIQSYEDKNDGEKDDDDKVSTIHATRKITTTLSERYLRA